jgi:hypothetical protein
MLRFVAVPKDPLIKEPCSIKNAAEIKIHNVLLRIHEAKRQSKKYSNINSFLPSFTLTLSYACFVQNYVSIYQLFCEKITFANLYNILFYI